MLDQTVPNPLAKNPNFHTHKVFASVGLILIGLIVGIGGTWYFVQSAEDKSPETDTTTVVKVSTSSAKTATTSSTKNETADWKTYKITKEGFNYLFKYPQTWKIHLDPNDFNLSSPEDEGYISQSTLQLTNDVGNLSYEKGATLIYLYKPITKETGESLTNVAKKQNLDYHNEKINNEKVGNYDAIWWEFTQGTDDTTKNTVYLLTDGSKVVKVTRQYATNKEADYKEIYKQILATLKFL